MVIDTTGRSFPEWCDNHSFGEFLADSADCTFSSSDNDRREVWLVCHSDGRVVEEVIRRPRPRRTVIARARLADIRRQFWPKIGRPVRPTHPAVIRWREERAK